MNVPRPNCVALAVSRIRWRFCSVRAKQVLRAKRDKPSGDREFQNVNDQLSRVSLSTREDPVFGLKRTTHLCRHGRHEQQRVRQTVDMVGHEETRDALRRHVFRSLDVDRTVEHSQDEPENGRKFVVAA